jgi:hypothetical protein
MAGSTSVGMPDFQNSGETSSSSSGLAVPSDSAQEVSHPEEDERNLAEELVSTTQEVSHPEDDERVLAEEVISTAQEVSHPEDDEQVLAEEVVSTAQEVSHPEDEEPDLVEEIYSNFCPPARSSGDGEKPSALEDPSLDPPPESKADWATEMEKLRKLSKDDDSSAVEEKIRLLHEAFVNRVEDTRAQEDHRTKIITRLEDGVSALARSRKDTSAANAAIAKLEETCRQLQREKKNLGKETRQIADEEKTRHQEMKDKFQQAMKDVQEKMDAELEVRQHFVKENDDLRGKLQKFTETYEEQEQQLSEQQAARTKEMETAQQTLREHEVKTVESRTKAAALEKQNEVLRKSQVALKDELQAILNKFDQFQEAVTGSNERHGQTKTEIDSLQARLQELEKENADLREGKNLSELSEEQKVAQKQRDALEKLCDNLQKENRKSEEQLRKLRAERA